MAQVRAAIFSRALSGGALTALGYALSQALRLGGNILLAHLLFPEAFGQMALVAMVLVGLQMFSDTGIAQAIARSPRGDAPEFLNTAWSVTVIRGLLLWATACLLAWPLAQVYGQPQLLELLPVAAISLVISGFNPTSIETANRHLLLVRLTGLDILAQSIGILGMVVVGVMTGSVWALVAGAVLTALMRLLLTRVFLPGARNRFHCDRAALAELLTFGKWIFLSTICGFLLAQGDKAILGFYLSAADLGIYNNAWFLASFPMLMSFAVVQKIMIPLYRDHPPAASLQNRRRFGRLKLGISAATLVLLAVMALIGPSLVAVLYDERYAAAGGMISVIALSLMPSVIGMGYDQAALAAGNGRGFFALLALRAVLQMLAIFIGAEAAGLSGAVLGLGVAGILGHPFVALLAHRHGAWDGRHDLIAFAMAAALGLLIVLLGAV